MQRLLDKKLGTTVLFAPPHALGLKIALITLIAALAFTACDRSTDNGGGGGVRSTLTINNAPKALSVIIFDGTEPTNSDEYITLYSSWIHKANGINSSGDKKTYPLGNTGGPFTENGKFLVVLMIGGGTEGVETYVKGDVSFSNGSATVDFSSMRKILPSE